MMGMGMMDEQLILSEKNKPKIRQNWSIHEKAFSSKDIDILVENIEKKYGWTYGTTMGSSSAEIRSSRIRWATGDEYLTNLLFTPVIKYAELARINIYKNCEIQYTEYGADYKGHYSMHHDVDWNRVDGLDRKISVTVQLSDANDYEGGSFVFDEIETPNRESCRQKGTILMFPSYHRHAVEPVTKGVRKSLVAWFYGPCWC